MRLLCLGFGYTARRFVERHGTRFSGIAATFRSDTSLAAVTAAGIAPVALASGMALTSALMAADVVLVSAGPDENGDPFVAAVTTALTAGAPIRHILYLSTVGVYGDHAGAWVTEETPPKPDSPRSRWRLAAEAAWLALSNAFSVQVQVFRLAGIYGPGRSAIDNLKAGTAKRIIKPGQVFNRIHVDDIGLTLAAALERGSPGAIWNVADDEPAPPQDVVTFAADLLGIAAPPEVPFSKANLSPMARSFYSETKRISNRALRDRLGVALACPTYREGMRAIMEAAR